MKIVDHGTWPLTPTDESLHTPGSELLWNESYYLDFATPDGSLGGYVRIGLYPTWDRAWYWACLVGPGREPVFLIDHDAPVTPGSANVEAARYKAGQEHATPFGTVHLTLDGAADSGVRLAFDLEWATVQGVYPYADLPRYEVPCRVTGTVVVGGETLEIDGFGERDHSWGERDWWGRVSWLWTAGRLDDGTHFHGMQANIGFALPWPCFTVAPDGDFGHRRGFTAETVFGDDDLPLRSTLRVPGAEMTATPLAFAPVTLTSPDGVLAEFPRALCRFETTDGRTGYGWTEWHQPPGWQDHGWSHLPEAEA